MTVINVVNPPILANMASCLLYLGPFGTPNGGTVFKDRGPSNRSITTNGSVVNSTTQTKFSPASIYFPGASSSYLSISSAQFTLGTNWIGTCLSYLSTANQPPAIFGSTTGLGEVGGGGAGYFYLYGFNGTGTGMQMYSTNTITVSVGWHRWVFGQTAAGANGFLYLDGVSVPLSNNGSGNGNFDTAYSIRIGVNGYNTFYPTEYLDELALWDSGSGVIPTASILNNLPQRRLIV